MTSDQTQVSYLTTTTVTSDVKHLFRPFVYLLWINFYLGPLPIFLLGYLFYLCCWVIWVFNIFWIWISYQIYGLNFFFHCLGCFSACYGFQKLYRALIWWSPILFSNFLLCFGCHVQKNHCQGPYQGALFLHFTLGVSGFQVLYLSLLYAWLNVCELCKIRV